MTANSVQLAKYTVGNQYSPGVTKLKQLCWFYMGSPLLTSYFLPFSWLKVAILRLFGASVGTGVRIKPGVRVKFPWRLTIGKSCWIGERVWIDNLALTVLGHDVCLSQGAYLCTGNHDWSKPTFDLRLGPITIGHSAWIGAKAVVGPGVTVSEGAVLTINSVASEPLSPWTIYTGNPAVAVKERSVRSSMQQR